MGERRLWTGAKTGSSAYIPPRPFRFALIGAGCVGTAVAQLLRARGNLITGVASRSTASAEEAAGRLKTSVFELGAGLPDADVVLVGVPGGALEGISETLSALLRRPVVACHFAGAVGISPLQGLVAAGGGVCAMHPVQACPDVATALKRLPGSAWGITCSEGLEPWAQSVVAEDLDGTPVRVGETDRPLWHAAAVVTSNGIAALLAVGEAILSAVEVAAPQRVLAPLAAATVANAAETSGSVALTGPVVRGESATIEGHLNALRAQAPDLVRFYELVARTVLLAARRAGRIEHDVETSLSALLGSP